MAVKFFTEAQTVLSLGLAIIDFFILIFRRVSLHTICIEPINSLKFQKMKQNLFFGIF
jgi:hypothetical protein